MKKERVRWMNTVFALFLLTGVVRSMYDINYEGPISPNPFKWLLGATISRKHLEETVDHIKEFAKYNRAKLSELQDHTEEVMVNLGQNGDYNLFHHKNGYVNSLQTCSKQYEIVENQASDRLGRLFPKEKKRALSGDSVANVLTALLENSGKLWDFLERREADRKIGNIEKKVQEQSFLLEGKIAGVSSSLEHLADIQFTRNNKIDQQIKTLHGKTKDALKNITERMDINNEFISAYLDCQNALNSAKEVNDHLKDVLEAVLLFHNDQPATMFISALETREMTREFQKRTNQEPFFLPEDSLKLIKFAKYEVVETEQGLILVAIFKIPAKKYSYRFYSFTPVVHYIPDEDQFCKLDEVSEGLIWTDLGSVGHVSREQLSDCQKSKEIIICDIQIHFSSLEVETESCAVSMMSNSSLSEVSRNCNVDCYKDDEPQIVDLKHGDYSITVKAPTPYVVRCGLDPSETHTLNIGQTVVQVKEGCSVTLDSMYELPGKASEFRAARYEEFQLKTPNFQLNDLYESRKKFLESDIMPVDDFGEFESITDNIKDLIHNEVGDIFERVPQMDQLPNNEVGMLKQIMNSVVAYCALAGVLVILLVKKIKKCRKEKIGENETV